MSGREFTIQELSKYTGEGGNNIYIAVNGTVFDVSSHPSGPSFYGVGQGYALFAGNDCTKALATMEFKFVNDPDVSELTPEHIETLNQWIEKFRSKYAIVGTLLPYSKTASA